MIVEGLKLTLLGMGVVYAFLGLLVLVMRLNARLLKPLTDRDEVAHRAFSLRRKAPRQEHDLAEKRRVLAVISAAITAHRARTGLAPCRSSRQEARMAMAAGVLPSQVLRGGKGGRLARLLFHDRFVLQGFRQARK